MEEVKKNGFIQSVRDNWLILAFLVSVIVTWTNFINADDRAEVRLTKLEDESVYQQKSQTQILTQLSQIQTDLSWIKTKLR